MGVRTPAINPGICCDASGQPAGSFANREISATFEKPL